MYHFELNACSNLSIQIGISAQLAGTVEYIDCISAEG